MVILPRSTVDISGAAKSNISVGAYVLRSTNCLTASSLSQNANPSRGPSLKRTERTYTVPTTHDPRSSKTG